MVWRTVHVNHAKPAKTPAGGFPVPTPPPAPPSPPPEYLSRNYTWGKPTRPPPQSAAPAEGSPQPAAPVAEPTQPAAPSHPASPPPSRPTTRSSANQNSAPRAERGPPAAPGRANENSRLNPPLRRSERLKTAINRPAQTPPAHSTHCINMARTYPYSLSYDACLGSTVDPFSFSSVYIEELYSGQRTYIKHVQQIVDLLPRTLDPSSRYTLREHVTPLGHQRMRDSLRLALWWFLPRDGDFRRAADGLHYYLARQGRRVVLRGGNVTSPLHESRLLRIHDPHRNQPAPVPASHLPASPKTKPVPRNYDTVPRIYDSVPRNNTNSVRRDQENISKNGPISGSDLGPTFQSSDVRARTRAPFDPVHNSVWYNSSHRTSDNHNCPPVPRNNEIDRQTDTQKNVPLPHKKKRINHKRRERRARERREASEAFNHDARWATQSSGAPSSTIVPDRLTQSGPQVSDPISAMWPAVYYPHESVGNSTANDNSSLEFGQELGGLAGPLPGLYKPAVPDPQHYTWANSSAATSAEIGPPSPTRNLAASSAGDRSRTGIIYPLQPRSKRPDICIEVEASLPEPAALRRTELQQPTREAPTSLPRPSRRLSRKRRCNRSTAIYRPAKRSPPRGHWCEL